MSDSSQEIESKDRAPENTGDTPDIVNAVNLDEGTTLLHAVIDMVNSGKAVKDNVIKDLFRLLGSWQVKVDLTQVAQVAHSLSRIKKLNTLIEVLENNLLDTSDPGALELCFLKMETKDKIKFLALLNDNRTVHAAFVAEKSGQPVLSSPENMAGNLENETEKPGEVKRLKVLSTPSQRRVVHMLQQMRSIAAKSSEAPIDAEVTQV